MSLLLNSSFTGASSACLLHRKTSRHRGRSHVHGVTCRQGGNDDRSNAARQQRSPLLLDRRDMLLGGLGGLYGVTAGPKVLAAPIMPPDLSKCHDAKAPALHDHCCPPYDPSETISEYGFPATPLRVRRPAHLVKDDQEYLDKYKEAVRRMKNLPAEHPWNYYQQANIHCQYCNDAYYQQNTDDVPVQVHFSWIFLPWHRYYLHFYERILGKLIDDDTFTIPFWNWDTKEGMTFPAIFQDASSPLYDPKRDQRHVKDGAILDLKYAYTDNPASDSEIIRENLCFIQKTFKYSLSLAELFMGDPVRAGEKEIQEANGQLEVIHNAAHMWVGEPDGYKEDMGDFSTAARDSVFYCHHSNVDRMWDIYRNLRGNQVEFEDKDWLDSTFLFHDENEQLVKIGDCLNPTKLRYTFEQVPLPWLGKINCQKTAETKSKATTELSLTRLNSSFTGASSACLLHRERSGRLHVPGVTCRQRNNDDRSDVARQQQSPSLLDRRDMLLGLGGLYGVTAGPKVLAKPIMPPDLSKCHDVTAPALHNHCCPPYNPSETILEYDFPATPLRVRRPLHLVKDDQGYMDKYKEAVRRMKNLPADHPWNYYQQANVHCQYCNYAYYQQNTDDVPIQVHNSWIFPPWHRYYLHFYERILGKLIDDDTFTIPFWNWDTKDGMAFPTIFQEESSPLYDPKRDQRHVKNGAIVDLKEDVQAQPVDGGGRRRSRRLTGSWKSSTMRCTGGSENRTDTRKTWATSPPPPAILFSSATTAMSTACGKSTVTSAATASSSKTTTGWTARSSSTTRTSNS
ncbi:polyphenol oxidase [Musa troglodytarum]|uniref:Polyphenol oxidase n=1 Tax=Musa troglodytarum TaxID=320322 RepID=A0A9E7KT01_9LILI|nr:polyphenol oxidase [Musa troglodytarum]